MGLLEAPPFLRIPVDRIIVRCPHLYPAYIRTEICLACLTQDGTFRLLNAAWEKLLASGRGELHGRALLELLPPEGKHAGEVALRRVLSRSEADPLTLDLRRKDGRLQRMDWYRRFDPYDTSLFIAGEAAALQSRKDHAPTTPGPA